MLDQSDNLNYLFFVCVVITNLCFFEEMFLLNPCFVLSKSLILSLIDKEHKVEHKV